MPAIGSSDHAIHARRFLGGASSSVGWSSTVRGGAASGAARYLGDLLGPGTGSRILFQTAEDERGQHRGKPQVGPASLRRGRRVVEMRHQKTGEIRRLERERPRRHEVEQDPQRVHVRWRVDPAAR